MSRLIAAGFFVAVALIAVIAADTSGMHAMSNDAVTVTSPNGELVLAVALGDEDSLTWNLSRRGAVLIEDSVLEVSFADGSFVNGLSIDDAGEARIEHFAVQRPAGKQRAADAHAHQRTITVRSAEGHQLAIDLVAFDDAVAHRFRQIDALGSAVDSTSFVFPEGASKYVQGYDRVDEYAPASESLYSDAVPVAFALPALDGWALPALFEMDAGWVLLAETGVGPDADGARLVNDRVREHRFAAPIANQLDGPVVEAPTGPITLPWKVMVTGDLGDVVASNAFELLATPTTMTDTSWIRPGRVSWSWWSESDSPRDPDRLRDFIDFAAEVGWEYSLIDANWNLMPEGTIEELVAYGRERNVGIFLWYNSGGDHNRVTEQPRDRMALREARRQEMEWLRDVGVVGLKVDFFQSDRASMNRMTLELLEDAADFGLLMNFHGITSPKGWHATWPHLLTTEAVRGAEQYKFDPFFPQTAPRHNTVLPFTRNVVGPMDYTPMTVSDVEFAHATTNAHELALGVVFESGLQHPADSPESYRGLGPDAMAFLRGLPAVWDEIRLLSGTPGDHVVFARRHDDQWWIGGINGREHPVELTLDLAPFDQAFRVGVDGATRDEIDYRDAQGSMTVRMAAFGGFFAFPVEGDDS